MGELGLSPSMFWSLTPREFWIKHRAFSRSEDRARSRIITMASLVGQFKEQDQQKMHRNARALERYPLKKWLLPREDE